MATLHTQGADFQSKPPCPAMLGTTMNETWRGEGILIVTSRKFWYIMNLSAKVGYYLEHIARKVN